MGSEPAERAMESFRRDNPRGKHGEHQYAPGDWGLDDDVIRERFRTYIGRFDIPLEAP